MEDGDVSSAMLSSKKCVPCRGGGTPLQGKELERFRSALLRWQVINERKLERSFKFPDFKSALVFTNQVGELAEADDHHPEILLAWGRVKITLWTHAVSGLTENDFILASKIDRLIPG